MVEIYALCDPDEKPRYVGQSSDARKRLVSHIRCAQIGRGGIKKVSEWIRSLESEGKLPILKILSTVKDVECNAEEQKWIKKLDRPRGSLLNVRRGRGARHDRKPRSATIWVRVFERHLKVYQSAARADGRTLSNWVCLQLDNAAGITTTLGE